MEGLRDKIESMDKEIDSLRKERDDLREQVALQAQEILNLRQNSMCQRCKIVPDKDLNVAITHTLTHGKAIWCVKFSPDGRYLVTGCNDGKARIYDVKTGSIVRALTDLLTKDPWIRSLCFSPDGTYLATGSNDSLIRVWKIATKYVQNAFKGHKKRITSLEFSPNGRSLISASRDNTVRVWNMHDGAAKVFNHEEPRYTDRESSFHSATQSPNGMHLAAGHTDGAVRIWDMFTGQLVHKLDGHKQWVACVLFMPDGTGLLSGGGDAAIKYWDLSHLESFRPRQRPGKARERSKELARRIAGSEFRPRLSQEFLGHTSNITSISMLPTGRWFASSSSDQTVRIWDAHNARLRCVLEDHKIWVWSVDVSPVGNYLASGDTEGTVRIWSYDET